MQCDCHRPCRMQSGAKAVCLREACQYHCLLEAYPLYLPAGEIAPALPMQCLLQALPMQLLLRPYDRRGGGPANTIVD